MNSIFLSHNHTDRNFARRLAADLRYAGIHVWVDEAEIKPGDSLFDRLESGLRDSEYVGVVLSPAAVASRWVRVELNAALQMEVRYGKIKVIPILLHPCDVPTFLLDKIHIDFTEGQRYHDSAAELIRFLLGAPKPVWLTGKDAARLVKLRGQPVGSLIGLSQQGILQQYIPHAVIAGARRDWLVADAKTGRSRIWVVDFYDPADSTLYPFGVHDGDVTDYPDGTLHNAPPLLAVNFVDSDIAVPVAVKAAQAADHVPRNADGFFVTTKLSYWRDRLSYVWTVSFLDLTLYRPTCGVIIDAKTGNLISCELSPQS
jgi:hypothetical protein